MSKCSELIPEQHIQESAKNNFSENFISENNDDKMLQYFEKMMHIFLI